MGLLSAIRQCALVLSLSVLLAADGFAAGPAEQLEYQVTYRGIFSAGTDLPIADLTLATNPPAASSNLQETRLEASSVAYPMVESLFPIRYRLRTWTSAERGELVGFETYEKMRKQRHHLYLRDGSEHGVRPLNPNQDAGRQELAQLAAGMRPSLEAAGDALFDRLGLLQRVRGEQLHSGAEFRLPVTNGKQRLVYKIGVESAQVLNLDGSPVASWKLRFDGIEVAPDGSEQVSHRPVYIWLSQAPGHIPLRADSRHAVGLFRVELKAPPVLQQFAQAGR